MYNLIVTAEEGAWEKESYSLPSSRFCEYTEEKIKVKFSNLNERNIDEIKSYPTLFAYEEFRVSHAYLGKVIDIKEKEKEIIIEYRINKDIQPIASESIAEIYNYLEIKTWEMSRTHWAIKDINLYKVLRDNKLIKSNKSLSVNKKPNHKSDSNKKNQILISPDVFSIPNDKSNPNLVSVMMPFKKEFDNVYDAIKNTCEEIGLECKRADDIWEDSTIIQDVFNLIYYSNVVIVDLSNVNPNVLYETGIAHTLGKSVIPISSDKGKLPFDLAHHRILTYLPNNEGLKQMKSKLKPRLLDLTL